MEEIKSRNDSSVKLKIIDCCNNKLWFINIKEATCKKSISEILEIISKELGVSFKYKEQYSESQLWNDFQYLGVSQEAKNKLTADESNECLYPNPVETLGIRSRSRLSYAEKLEIMKMIRKNLLNKSEICEKWSISRSTISRIIKEFESKKSPHYSQVRPLPSKLLQSKRIYALIAEYLKSQDKPFTSKTIQSKIIQDLGMKIPFHI